MTQVDLTDAEVNDLLTAKRADIRRLQCDLVDAGNKIWDARNEARSKGYEEGLSEGQRTAHDRALSQTKAGVCALLSALQNGQKIYAIKAVRELTALGLKEAKDLVELYQSPEETKTVTVTHYYNGVSYEVVARRYHYLSGEGNLLCKEVHPGKKAAVIAEATMRAVYRSLGYEVLPSF